MKATGFVLNARLPGDPEQAGSFSKAVQWAQEGKISRIIIQASHWPHADANRAAMPKWKEALNPLGVKVGVQTWIDFAEPPTVVEGRLRQIRQECAPELWCLDMESPPVSNLGANCAPLMLLTKPEPCIISYNVPAERLAFDFRRFGSRLPACEVHSQCYDVDGNLTITPQEHITSAFKPTAVWASGGGSAWWYRVLIGTTWSWRQAGFYNSTRGVPLVRIDGHTVWADAHVVGEHVEFHSARVVRDNNATPVGRVFGMAQYEKIGWTVATTRPITPDKLHELAQNAHAPGMPVRRMCSLYTVENTTQDQIDALCGAI